jgi:BirA family biotin operon repressor/biotin-[acetyl-CoA-carboxylase] ligase
MTTSMHDLARVRETIAMRGGRLGEPLVVQEETSSTNDDAKRGAREGAPHGAVWLADAQTRGRGRQGHSWISPRGENLLFSIVLRVDCPPARVPTLALAVGLAIRDAVADAIRPLGRADDVLVKWPNDVVVRARDGARPRKIAGVLLESSVVGGSVEYVVAGVGINVHTREFPPELSEIATSLALEGVAAPDRAAVLADVLARIDQDVEHVANHGLGLVHARLDRADALRGRAIALGDGTRGVGGGIDVDGRLAVRRDDGTTIRVASGEITDFA